METKESSACTKDSSGHYFIAIISLTIIYLKYLALSKIFSIIITKSQNHVLLFSVQCQPKQLHQPKEI